MDMRRREFIMLFGGAAATWPLAARAQSQQRVRLIGVLAGATENDPQAQRRVGAFTQALRDLGWSDGANIKLEKRAAPPAQFR
jgi:putative ABC transport system substrate-binding protein